MRIISNFKDYYDHGMMYGVDTQNVFSRVNNNGKMREESLLNFITETEWKRMALDFRLYSATRLSTCSLEKMILGFCGVLYRVYKIDYGLNEKAKKNLFFYTEADAFVALNETPRRRYFSYREKSSTILTKENLSIFLKINSPIFVLTRNEKIAWYPRLIDYSFFNIKNATVAFSEIEQFNTNVLKTTSIPLDLSNKDRLIQHGFDIKESFRHRKNS